MNIYDNVLELVGDTPLMRAGKLAEEFGAVGNVLLKLEFFNPGGSIKDRVALNIIRDAEERGVLKGGGKVPPAIIEATSGNTGIGIAMVAAAKGYRAIIVMPENMSEERKKIIRAYGAELVLTPAEAGMKGAAAEAERLLAKNEGAIIAGQFVNPANPEAHYFSTAEEIWDDCGGAVDAVVAGIGTGGTISGLAKFFKEKDENIKIVAVEPFESPLLSEGIAGVHKIQGIGANFVPKVLDCDSYDEIIKVKGDDAIAMMGRLAAVEGIFCGISSGAALRAALEIAKREEFRGKNIIAILPDTGERYLSVLF